MHSFWFDLAACFALSKDREMLGCIATPNPFKMSILSMDCGIMFLRRHVLSNTTPWGGNTTENKKH
jgi:hypothetical protein